jgi:hypothetical protein
VPEPQWKRDKQENAGKIFRRNQRVRAHEEVREASDVRTLSINGKPQWDCDKRL